VGYLRTGWDLDAGGAQLSGRAPPPRGSSRSLSFSRLALLWLASASVRSVWWVASSPRIETEGRGVGAVVAGG
jgi:hypothetical protein